MTTLEATDKVKLVGEPYSRLINAMASLKSGEMGHDGRRLFGLNYGDGSRLPGVRRRLDLSPGKQNDSQTAKRFLNSKSFLI